MFVATKSAGNGEHTKYCSKGCQFEGAKRGTERACVCCGQKFYMNPSAMKQRHEESCCSRACANEFYRDARHGNWRGGEYQSESAGYTFVKNPREGYEGQYFGSHRVTVEHIIGRKLLRTEVVLRINNDKSDDRPENLYLCESMSEFAKRRQGSLPWPTKSNIRDYVNSCSL
jgi:hypothetical protein